VRLLGSGGLDFFEWQGSDGPQYGSLVPFNVQDLNGQVYVTYAGLGLLGWRKKRKALSA
jgi:hypothetical protein